jgi:hypothetical protein
VTGEIIAPIPRSRLVRYVETFSEHRYSRRALAAVAFADSSFLPIPPDLLLVPMAFVRPKQIWALSLICTVASSLGAVVGRPEVTLGALESSGDQNAGIAMCRMPIGRKRCRAPSKRNGAGSRRVDIAHHGETPVLRSVLGLGRSLDISSACAANRFGRRWSNAMGSDIVPDWRSNTLA